MKKIILLSVSFLIFISSAQAWVPPSGFLVKKITAKKNRLKSAYVSTKVHLLTKDLKESGVHFIESTFYLRSKNSLSSVVLNESGEVLFRASRKLDDKSNAVGGFARAVNVMSFHNDLDLLVQSFLEIKLPVLKEESLLALETEKERRAAEKTHLKRFDDKVAWVIAEDLLDNNKSQLWIEKNTFYPRRLYFKDGGKSIEVVFNQFRYYQDFPYANETITLFDAYGIKSEVAQLIVNKQPKGDLFNVKSQGFTSLGLELEDDVKSLIESYFSYLR